MRRSFVLTGSLLLATGITGCFMVNNSSLEKNPQTSSLSGAENIPEETFLSKEDRLKQLQKRFNFRSVIKKGDYFFAKNQPEIALKLYLNSYRNLPSDYNLEKKIANTYFELKSFNGAYLYYKKALSQNNSPELHKPFFWAVLSTANKPLIDRELSSSFATGKSGLEYARLARICYDGFLACENYVNAYSGSSEEILNLKTLLSNAKNVSPDPSYKQALLVGQFIKEKFYLAGGILGEDILRKQPNYGPVLKITGVAYYELGQYEKAKLYLARYYNMNTKDTQSSYLLGMIQFYLKDYVSSNLYFNTAVLNGFKPKIEVERRLIYNYYLLEDKKSMFKIFRYLLAEPETSPDDFYVAIFSSIEFGELSKAFLWSNKGLELFPDNDSLFAFRGWIYRGQKESIKAKEDLEKSIALNPRNAIALYNLGMLSFEQGDSESAKSFFNKAITVDKDSFFGEESSIMLQNIATLTPSESSQTTTGTQNVAN